MCLARAEVKKKGGRKRKRKTFAKICVPARKWKKRAAHRNDDNEKKETNAPKLKSRRTTQNGEVVGGGSTTSNHNGTGTRGSTTSNHNGTLHHHHHQHDNKHKSSNGRLLVTPTAATVAGHEAGAVLTISEQKVVDGCSTDHCAFCFDVLLNFFDERFGFPSDRGHYFARCSFVKINNEIGFSLSLLCLSLSLSLSPSLLSPLINSL